MKYPTQSALENHFLESILPNSKVVQEKQFSKTKDFYHPQKFIWNNPHRTSNKIYGYYHRFNDNYAKFKQPVIEKLEESDKKRDQQERIERILQMRNNTRDRFFDRKKSRESLMARCFSQTQQNTPIKNGETLNSKKVLHQNYHYKDQYKTVDNSQLKNFNSQRVMKIGQSYKLGVMKSQQKAANIERLIYEQRQVNHQHIREKFENRKYKNDQTISRILKKSNMKSTLN